MLEKFPFAQVLLANRPELAESFFVLWRLTKQRKWREYAWKLAESIDLNCGTPHGFAGCERVDQTPLKRFTYQPVHLVSATLKYLYLIFAEDDTIELDKWVFNAFGHPLPVKGANEAYPANGPYVPSTFN